MPDYSRDGVPVDAATATYVDGRLRPGYRSALAQGESIGFNLAFADTTAPTGHLMFHDSGIQISDAERDFVVARAQSHFDLRHAYMGDHAPKFTPEMGAHAVAAHVGLRQQNASDLARFAADAAPLRDEAELAYQRSARFHNDWRR